MKVLDNDILYMYLEDGILKGYYKVDVLDKEIAEMAIKSRLEFQNGVSYKSIFDATNLTTITPEARKILSGPKSHLGFKAVAFIRKSAFTNALGNFYLMYANVPVPTKLFRDEKQARKWLDSIDV
ncbi:MAG: hypothetical protein JXQ87_13630 [Bacteroidia bacterium]